jgi:hypothetical protein
VAQRRLLDVQAHTLFVDGLQHEMDMRVRFVGVQDEGVPVLTPKLLSCEVSHRFHESRTSGGTICGTRGLRGMCNRERRGARSIHSHSRTHRLPWPDRDAPTRAVARDRPADARSCGAIGPGEFRSIFSETRTRSKKTIYAG